MLTVTSLVLFGFASYLYSERKFYRVQQQIIQTYLNRRVSHTKIEGCRGRTINYLDGTMQVEWDNGECGWYATTDLVF